MSTTGAYQSSPAEAGEPEAASLLSVKDLRVEFQRRGRRPVHAVDGISFDVEPGQTIGVVGESGCGKSVTSLAILGLLPKRGVQVTGSVRFAGRELFKLSDQELRELRGREIAMALACRPKLLIADEPTTALGVTIQAQILDLLRAQIADRDTALLLITHDLGVVAGTCETVHVMYPGRIVESADRYELFARPRHPYTAGLLASVPRLDQPRGDPLRPIRGSAQGMRVRIPLRQPGRRVHR